MNRLIILRHATAAQQGRKPGDRERPLDGSGRAEVAGVAQWLHAEGLAPDAVVCSTAVRTRETLELLALNEVPATYSDRLYLGTAEAYFAEAEDAVAETVMIVGHNPTCAAIVAGLRGIDDMLGRPFDGHFPPASICLADRSGTGWQASKIRFGV